ncbi:cysteine peptidase family C39 domain-containing protein [Algoriphagus sp. D3-2-R+10]|uniref:cysteine peptidase family C39 domain-containing protein n=1 Tax=Algoriphagus aurantiacus TaxID=3103948 RepID=UPI002B36A5F4|nr:cysteine peptidase family C39 domain-containing protein [Algoriphagus sp. D3-2-R+10]MEB2774735.1 cysteine peptidase family C39 domain-containing protein [Algoriphagus sp. D3-2-R+10]
MDNCLIICKRLLESLKVPFTHKFLKEKVLTHPQYPSLLSISDTLEEYGVASIAAKLSPDRLNDIPLPGIVQVSQANGEYFTVITAVSHNTVSIFDEKGNLKDFSRVDFLKRWTGVSLLVEAKEDAEEPGINQRVRDQSIIQGAAIVFGVSLLFWLGLRIIESEILGFHLFYFLIKLLGLAISGILLWYYHDKENTTLQSFCSGGENADCNSVLDSKTFELLDGRINLSLLAFAYFFAGIGLLSILVFSAITFLAWLSLATIPIVVYSFYYQAKTIKKWCRFCLMIQGVLLFEVLTVLGGSLWLGGLDAIVVILFLFLFTGLVLSGILITPLLGLQDEIYKSKRQLAQLKSKKDLFELSLSRSKKIKNKPQGIGILIKGENPKYQIIKVCNPYCGPCSGIHPELESLFEKGNIDLQIIFTGVEGDEGKEKTVKHLMAIAATGKPDYTRQALDDWYGAEKKDYDRFAIKYPMNGEISQQKEKIDAMEHWCKEEAISYTPTLFIDGYKLPDDYRIEDLRYLLN